MTNSQNSHASAPRSRRGVTTAVLAVVIGATALSATACGQDSRSDGRRGEGSGQGPGGGPMGVDGEGVSAMRGEDLATRLDALPIDELTQEERDGLAYMRDEERLAGDVYRELDERWALRTFANIASAEATHTDAVAALLERHGLDDPADGQAAGDYREPAFQALHDELVARGGESIEAALSVGATIEELDISDLRSRASDSADIALVYSNLERGSRNHLRAFVSQLDRRGVTYEPTHLSPAEFDAIVDSDMERGAGG